MYERVCQNTWYNPTLISLRLKCDYWLLDKCQGSFLLIVIKKRKKKGRRVGGLSEAVWKAKKVHHYLTKPRVKHWPVTVWRRSIWQRRHMVISPRRLHFLSMFPLLLSHPPSTLTMECIWKINCVSRNVICRLLLPEFLYLPPCSCLCFFLNFFSFPSLCLHLVSITVPLSFFGLSPVKYMHHWRDHIILGNCMGVLHSTSTQFLI